jgi:lambda family phage portal protein
MNALDRIIEFINPEAALRRERARVATSFVRAYESASHGRRTKGWNAGATSANTEIRTGLKTLRNRSRDMVRNNPYAKRAVEAIANNTVGSGIRPQPWSDGASEKRIKKLWQAWAETTACDHFGEHDFYGLQKQIMRAVAESGEALIRWRIDPRNPSGIPLRIQIVESDYIDESKDIFRAFSKIGENTIEQGIELDSEGRRVAYWLFDTHPGEGFGTLESRRIPAENVIHVYEKLRPGQLRGVPMGVSAFVRLRDFDQYEDAQLVRQKIAACFTAFVYDGSPSSTVVKDTTTGDYVDKLQPGAIEHLDPGQNVTFANPPGVTGYSEYSRQILRGIAAAYGITYEVLTGDLTGVNFSSGRMGWIEMQRNIQDWQHNVMINTLCNPVWSKFVELGVVSGKLFPTDRVSADWTPPRRELIDPEKEIKGMATTVRNGLNSYSDVVRQLGRDADDVIEELRDDFRKFDAAGLVLDIDPRKAGPAGQPVMQAKEDPPPAKTDEE